MPLVRAVGLVVAAWVVDCGGASVAPEQGATVVVVWSATAADVGTCGDRVLLRGDSLEVTPGGEDDTASIQCALDQGDTVCDCRFDHLCSGVPVTNVRDADNVDLGTNDRIVP
jgi:hypothetical protein